MNSKIVTDVLNLYEHQCLFNVVTGFKGYNDKLRFWSDVKRKLNEEMQPNRIVLPDWIISFVNQRNKSQMHVNEDQARIEQRHKYYPITVRSAIDKLRAISQVNFANVPILFLIQQPVNSDRVVVGILERKWLGAQLKYHLSFYERSACIDVYPSPPRLFCILYQNMSKSFPPIMYTDSALLTSDDKFLNAIEFIAHVADGNDYRVQFGQLLIDQRYLSQRKN